MRCIQQPNHSSDNSALLDKTYLSFKDRKRIIIKTYDKSPAELPDRCFEFILHKLSSYDSYSDIYCIL